MGGGLLLSLFLRFVRFRRFFGRVMVSFFLLRRLLLLFLLLSWVSLPAVTGRVVACPGVVRPLVVVAPAVVLLVTLSVVFFTLSGPVALASPVGETVLFLPRSVVLSHVSSWQLRGRVHGERFA